VKTVTYLKAGLVSRASLQRRLDAESLGNTEAASAEKESDLFTKVLVQVRERLVRLHRGQTMTDYALILAAIAIAVFGVYKTMGQSTSGLASGVNSTLLTRKPRFLRHAPH